MISTAVKYGQYTFVSSWDLDETGITTYYNTDVWFTVFLLDHGCF